MSAQSAVPVIRDVACLILGGWGFGWQITHGAELILMSGSLLLLGGPAVMASWPVGSMPGNARSPGSPPSASPSVSPGQSSPVGGER